MAIRFRFRSSLCFDSVDIEGRSSISVRDLKSKIVLNKHLNACQDFDLVLCDATTGREYSDDNTQLPSGSSVIIKRVPSESPRSDLARGFPVEDVRTKSKNAVENSAPMNVESDNFDDFGVDLCPVFGATISGSDLDVDKKLYLTNNNSDKQVARLFETPMVGCEKPEASELSEAIPRGIGDNKDTSQIRLEPRAGELVKPKIVVSANSVAVQSIDLPVELKCTLCDTCFKEAVMIPCCQHSFCEKCIRLVLIEKGRCPKCLSTKCRVENLLPNVSLRQAIERFLESQMLMKNTENAFGYAPDGESGIQVNEMSCAASIQKREEELPHSPCTTGRGSNQIIANPINANSSLPHKLKHIDGKRNVSTHHVDLQTQDENTFVEFQGENQPKQKEVESTTKKAAAWNYSADASRSFVEPGRQRKGDRTCYSCGSPDHFVRECPAASNRYPIPQTGTAMFPQGVPGYLSPYWNQAPFPQMRPYFNPYSNPFTATMVPPTPFAVHPYMPSPFSSMTPFGGFAMMGGVASSPVPSAEWHQQFHGYEGRKNISNSKRQQAFDDDDDDDENMRKMHYYSEAKRSHDLKALRHRNDDQIQSRNSSTEKSHREHHYSRFDDEPERSSSEVEDMPCNSHWCSEQKHRHCLRDSKKHDSGRKQSHGDSIPSNHESFRPKDNKIKQALSDTKREKHKHNSHESIRSKDNKRKQCSGDSLHSYHERKQLVSDAKREKKHKHNSWSESGLEPSISSDKKTRCNERESSHGSKHSRHNSSSMNNELSHERWQMASGSDEDAEDDYNLKRK